jgi:hypothetical protein
MAFPMTWKAMVLPRVAAKRKSEKRLDAAADQPSLEPERSN